MVAVTTLSDTARRRRLLDNAMVFVTAPEGEPFGELVISVLLAEDSGVELGGNCDVAVAVAMLENGGFTPVGCAPLLAAALAAVLWVAFRSRDDRLSFFDREAARARRGVSQIVL